LRIRACVARPATAKCGGRKLHKGRSPTAIFWNPNRRTGGEQLPFVMCWFAFQVIVTIFFDFYTLLRIIF